MRVTINNVNKALRALPGARGDEEIVQGNGYWYFAGYEAAGFYSQSVYTMRLNDFTLDQWVEMYVDKRDETRSRRGAA